MKSAITLSETQRTAIAKEVGPFLHYLESEDFRSFEKNRRARVGFFQNDLPRRLDELSEADVEAIVGQLWTSAVWSNKAYLVQKIINDNGLDRLRTFNQLLQAIAQELEQAGVPDVDLLLVDLFLYQIARAKPGK